MMKRIQASKEVCQQVGMELAEIIVDAKLLESKSAVRRMIKQHGIRLDDELVQDPMARVAFSDSTGWILLEEKPKK